MALYVVDTESGKKTLYSKWVKTNGVPGNTTSTPSKPTQTKKSKKKSGPMRLAGK